VNEERTIMSGESKVGKTHEQGKSDLTLLSRENKVPSFTGRAILVI
jgi:hypothetical protein